MHTRNASAKTAAMHRSPALAVPAFYAIPSRPAAISATPRNGVMKPSCVRCDLGFENALKNLDGRCRWNTEAMPPAHKSARATRHAIFEGRCEPNTALANTTHSKSPNPARWHAVDITRGQWTCIASQLLSGERDRPPSVRFRIRDARGTRGQRFRRAPLRCENRDRSCRQQRAPL